MQRDSVRVIHSWADSRRLSRFDLFVSHECLAMIACFVSYFFLSTSASLRLPPPSWITSASLSMTAPEPAARHAHGTQIVALKRARTWRSQHTSLVFSVPLVPVLTEPDRRRATSPTTLSEGQMDTHSAKVECGSAAAATKDDCLRSREGARVRSPDPLIGTGNWRNRVGPFSLFRRATARRAQTADHICPADRSLSSS